MHSVGFWVRVLSRRVRCPRRFAVLERIQAGTVTGDGSCVSQIEWPGFQRWHDTFRILLPADRLSYFQIEFPAANSGGSRGLCRAWTPDRYLREPPLSGIRAAFASLHYVARRRWGSLTNAVAPRDGGECFEMEGTGQRGDGSMIGAHHSVDVKMGKEVSRKTSRSDTQIRQCMHGMQCMHAYFL